MRHFKLPPQMLRLILLTVGIVGTYLVARAIMTPTSFGQYGWYRGDALEENAARLPSYAGRRACDECHSEEFALLSRGRHASISCETCHGPGKAHSDDPEINMHKPTDGDCLRCHEANPARPVFMKQIDADDHYRGDRCIECHVPHHPTEVP